MHIYLRALAVSDLCVLYSGLLRWWALIMFKKDVRKWHVIVCKGHTWFVYVSVAVSAWLLVVMTFERTWSTCLPHRVNTFCTTRKAFGFIFFIIVFHSALLSHFLVGLTIKKNADGEYVCGAISGSYDYFVHDIWPVVDICIMSLLPFSCLIVGNIIIVWRTFLSLRTAAELNISSGANTQQRRRQRASSMTIILLGLCAVFFLTTSPICVYNLWEMGGSATMYVKGPADKARLELIWAFMNVAMYCNNTFNFYLYCLTGRKFRSEMRKRLTRIRGDSPSQCNGISGNSFQRFMVLNDVNRVSTFVDNRGSTHRMSSIRVHNGWWIFSCLFQWYFIIYLMEW